VPKANQTARVTRWQERIVAANRIYKEWEESYECKHLTEYYCGKQWRGWGDDEAKDKYVTNLFFPTLEIRLPSLLFYKPQAKCEPRPSRADDLNEQAGARAELCQHTIQTLIDKKETRFQLQTLLALKDAEFRFGLVEVGYSADWVDNPNAGKPLLNERDEAMTDDTGQSIMGPDRIVKSESLYVRRIPPKTFRVSLSGLNVLEENDWCGYYEWHYVEDVKKNPKYRNTADLQAGGSLKDMPALSRDDERERHRGMVKLWKIWDLRGKVKHVIADGAEKFLVEGEPFTYLPLAAIKYCEAPDEWYPVPPTYNWLSPQDEYNESREMQRAHRRRFTRRYTFMDGGIDQSELDKLESGEDGVYAKRNTPDDPIKPVADAPLDGAIWNQLAVIKDDFREVSGVSGDQRGVVETETATQANIVDMRSRIRESSARRQVAEWLGDICHLILCTVREKMQLPFWIKINSDPAAGDVEGMLKTAQLWKEITSTDLGDLDLDISVDVAALSPVSEDQQRLVWNQVLALLTNPTLLLLLMQSEVLLRKTLRMYGITSDAEVKEIQKVGASMLQIQLAMQASAGGGQPGATATAGQPTQPPAGMPAASGMIQ